MVQDLLTWLEASGCHFCLAVCQGRGFRKKSSAIVSCAYWRNVLWFSKGEGGLAAWDLWSACGLLRALVAGHVVHGICGRKEEQMVMGWGPMCIRGTDV